jgi:hypothetical protein
VAYVWVVGLVAACAVSTGCGSGAEQHGSLDAHSFPDSGQDRDAALGNQGDDASDDGAAEAAGPLDPDGSSCGTGTGTVVVTLGVPYGVEGGCECDWSATGTDASASSGSVDTGLPAFTVTCVTAGSNYSVDCMCGSDASSGAAPGSCEGAASFSVTPGTTTEVQVAVDCPGSAGP